MFQESSGAIDPKGGTARCYFAVSPKKLTVLDDKTKVSIAQNSIVLSNMYLQCPVSQYVA